jgi:HSP20 family protein
MNTLTFNNGRRGSLLSWDPLRLFDDLMSWEPAGSQTVWSAYVSPIKVANDDDGSTITVDMPGIGPEDLELTFQDGNLAISGKRGERTYSYTVALGDAVDPEHIEADLDKGVLTVRAFKKPEAKPRKIALKK